RHAGSPTRAPRWDATTLRPRRSKPEPHPTSIADVTRPPQARRVRTSGRVWCGAKAAPRRVCQGSGGGPEQREEARDEREPARRAADRDEDPPVMPPPPLAEASQQLARRVGVPSGQYERRNCEAEPDQIIDPHL